MWAMVCTTTITAMLSVYVPSSHTTNTAIRAHGHHAIWLMTANGPPSISGIQTSGSSSAMACIRPHPSVHHPSVHPYAMAVGSIRREGHGANGGRDGGPYTTMAHTTTSTTTTYGATTAYSRNGVTSLKH